MHFAVTHWVSKMPGLENKESWQSWAEKPYYSAKGERKVTRLKVPPMINRRCSHLSKVALEVALELTENHNVDYMVFASRHGEIERTVRLLKTQSLNETLSPMDFSQSVHNTAAGLFTIIKKTNIPVTSLTAGEKTLEMAFVDSFSYLSQNQGQKVALIYFEDILPEMYQKDVEETAVQHGLGLILQNCEGKKEELSEIPEGSEGLPQSFSFLHYFLNQTQQSSLSLNSNGSWRV